MYPSDGNNGWQTSQTRGGNPDPYPESYPDSNGPNQPSAFRPNSAAFEYMRSLDPSSGGVGGVGGATSPPRQRDYTQGRGVSPPRDHSPTTGSSRRDGRSPRRMRRAVTPRNDMPGPPGVASRTMSQTPMSMPSTRPLLVSGPAQSDQLGPSGPGVGVGVYDDDPTAASRPSPASPYMDSTPGPAALKHEESDNSFLPAAPYQNMLRSFDAGGNNNNNIEGPGGDPTLERARVMASRTDNGAANSRPMPEPGRPQPPEAPPLEPALPAAQLGRRILTNKPKREPDLVRGKAVQQIAPSEKKAHVLCAGCGVMLQIPKTAIVVHCRNCNGVHPTASCPLPNGSR